MQGRRNSNRFPSVFLIVALSPLFIGAALLVGLTSSGPVFFLQERVGVNKKKFWMIKFRTMVEAAGRALPRRRVCFAGSPADPGCP